MEKENNQAYVYILTNEFNSTIHIGVTNNLLKKVFEYKGRVSTCMNKTMAASKLVHYETFSDISHAILREKELRIASRKKNMELVSKYNPNWDDLYGELG